MNDKKTNKLAIAAFVAAAVFTGAGYYVQSAIDTQDPTSSVSVEQDGKYQLGKHYLKLDKSYPEYKGKVVEYINYLCVHCNSVVPKVKSFDEGKDIVEVLHIGSPGNNFLEKLFFAIEDMGRGDIHTLIQEKAVNGKLANEDQFISFVVSQGIKKEELLSKMESKSVSEKIKKANAMAFESGISGTPSFIIDGQYVLNIGEISSWDMAFDVMEEIYNKEMK